MQFVWKRFCLYGEKNLKIRHKIIKKTARKKDILLDFGGNASNADYILIAKERNNMMEKIEYKHDVQYYETDKMGITHHSNYIRWMEEARVDFLKKIGWDYDKLEEIGVISPVTKIDCKYKNNTTFADRVTIVVSVEECKGVRLKLAYEMKKQDGSDVCEAHSEHCFMNEKGQVLNLKKDFPAFYEAIVSRL